MVLSAAMRQQYAAQLSALAGRLVPADHAPEQLLTLALETLATGDFQTRWDVAKLLPQLVRAASVPLEAAIAPLRTLLLRDDEELSWFVIRILGQLDHPDALADVLPVVVETLKTTHSAEVQSMAAEVLAGYGIQAIAALTELLTHDAWRLLAVRSLAQIRHADAIAPLLEVVQDADPDVRVAAIAALGSFPDPRIPPVLIHALHDLTARVRREAVVALGLRTHLLDLDFVSLLQPLLRDFNLEVCRQAAIALGRLGTDAAADALFEVLRSPHTPLPLQIEIIRALSWVGTATSLGYLQQGLTQCLDLQVIQEIITALGRIEIPTLQPQAAQVLMAALSSHPYVLESGEQSGEQSSEQSDELKQAIAFSLGQLQQLQALDPLIHLLAEPDARVQLHAIAALKQLDADAARARLAALATADDLPENLRQGIAIALAEWQPIPNDTDF
jgi:HEAT repeat protein